MPFEAIPSSPLTKSVSTRNAGSLMRLAAGVFRARRIIRRFAPDVVVGTGGYTTAAVLLAQRTLRGKIVIHEQNAVPGRTNLWLARIADRVCVTFDSSAVFFPAGKVATTGMPIRSEFAAVPGKAEARIALGLSESKFTLLVGGGSQGARKLNELIINALSMFADDSTQVLHQAGERNIQEACGLLDTLYGEDVPLEYRIEAYVDMPRAMAASDLVVSRSGASTIAEITASGLPSILVPYPFAYANHQKKNAEYVVGHNAAVLCEESACTPAMVADLIATLRGSPDKLAAMASASASLGKPDAARRVAEVVRSLAGVS